MSDRIIGFLHGLTLYPFPVAMPPGMAFDGWSDQKIDAYGAGVMTFFVLSVVGVGLLLWSAA